jgi:flagellar hook-associated protein 1 FlgK
VNVSIGKQTDGSYNIFIGTGQSLVTGLTAGSLTLTDDPLEQGKKNVSFNFGNTPVAIPQQSLETGGALGGLLSFRRTSLDTAQNALGRIALGIAQTFNEQHQLGQDLNGVLGGNFFNIDATSPTISGATSNTGSLAFTATGIDAGKLTTSNYLVSFDGTNYSLTDSATNVTTSGLNNAQLLTALSNVGLTLTTSGTPNAGDRFLILPTRNGARDLSVAITDPSAIAAAAPIKTAANPANTGTASVSLGAVDSATQPPLNANLQATVTLTFTSASAFDVSGAGTGNPTGVAYTAAGDISYNGWIIQINGTPAAGDVFTISANTGGVGDNRNALALAALQSSNTLVNNAAGNPTTSYQGAYAQLVSAIGSDTQRVTNGSEAQQALLDNTVQTQQSLSGVNLDEEAANLLRFQQAYQAAARIIQTSTTLFDTILGIR